ncbi:MAG TPA: Lrp/AsnC family transcriptional regulator [Mycobacteriales bacterium]|jgi:Lrp/AsnC family leucine-responsive transcriptional regulator|nr:Lrp/AsnC family transcriptional regulator [Mycobacteriales bacterium]
MRQVDTVDRQLIEALRRNARATYAELARAVGLSAPAVHERVAKLEASGVITGYHAAVAPAALGLGVSALVGIVQGDSADADLIAGEVRGMSEIEDCWFVAGEETFVVKVRVPDVAALEQTIGALNRIRGVAHTRTTVVLSTRFEGRVRPATEAERAHRSADLPEPGIPNG